MRLSHLFAALLLLTSLAVAQPNAEKAPSEKSGAGLSSLPANAQGPISAALGKDDSGYWLRPSADGFRGENPRQALTAEFTQRGAEVRTHNLRWGLETRGYGYGDALLPVRAVAPRERANRVECRHDALTEWYENGPLGLEQGFALARRPGKANGQPLTIELGLRGDFVAALEPGGKGLELRGKDGKTALRYTGLSARDATGGELRSWLELRGDRLLLRVEDARAKYPIVLDPWVQQAKLTAADGAAADQFGNSVAVGGSTAIVGAPNHDSQGAAYVFVQNGGTWSQQAELTASDGAASDKFGWSVAVNGSTAVVGAYNHNGMGSAYVFVRSGTTWSQQAKLVASDGLADDYFGNSVALSGSTAIVGAPNHDSQGAAYVFVQNGTTWSQQAELTPPPHGGGEFGWSVAVDGSTAVMGAPGVVIGSNYFEGAAYVFVQNGGTWSQQAELTASDGAANDEFGYSVAVSGNTVVVGGEDSNLNLGAAYVFVQSGGTWSQQAELTDGVKNDSDEFGGSVAVSGSTVVVGAPGSNNFQGAAYVFVQSGTTWSQQAELTSSDDAQSAFFGASVWVSGSAAVVGAYWEGVGSNTHQGAAYVFGSASSQLGFNTLASFDYTDGAYPTALIEGSDGNFYGTTDKGGQSGDVCKNSCGTIFEITPAGTLTNPHLFDGTDGNGPSGLVQSASGVFYGTTSYGGANNCTSYGSYGPCGAVFQMTAGGALTPLYSFCAETNCADGAIPWGGLVLGSDGEYYGTTSAGGTGSCNSSLGPGCGTVFKITTGGALTPLHSFVGTDGAYPYSRLVLGSDGSFYGTTDGGGTHGYGTVFKITPEGGLSTIYNFAGTDGAFPYAGLVLAKNGNFYGTTSAISPANLGGGPSCTSSGVGDGTVFEITSGGALTTLHTFKGTDGAFPYAGVIQGLDGNFYGMTGCGGSNGDGTIFELTQSGTLTTLHTFAGTDGIFPLAGMVQASDGTFYGTTVQGGADNYGTVFSLSLGSTAVTLTPSSHKFPKTKVGATSAAYKFTLTNNSPTTLSGISYSTGAPFAVSTSTCTATLGSKKKCTISVTFSPKKTGTATGTLTVTDSANNSPQTSSLSGTGD